jgi:hypothetical protein
VTRAPQSLPAPQAAADARWTARLTKTQRAVLRLLAGAHGGWSRFEITARLPRYAAVDGALTRLIGLGFVARYTIHPAEAHRYRLTDDGLRRAKMTRPRLPCTYTDEERMAAARAGRRIVQGIR